MDPRPAVIDEVPFEESDIVDVRESPFAPSNFFDHGFGAAQFGADNEEDWEDDDDEDDDEIPGQPDCRPQ